MREHELDKVLLAQIKSHLDADAERLDPAIAARLQQSRRQAVALAEQKRFRFFAIPRWVTAGGLATLAVVAVASSFWLSEPRQKVRDVEDIEVLTAQGHLEMYEELEFYRWLSESRDSQQSH